MRNSLGKYLIIIKYYLYLIKKFHNTCLGHPVVNDPLYNHPVFGPNKGKGGEIGKISFDTKIVTLSKHEDFINVNLQSLSYFQL